MEVTRVEQHAYIEIVVVRGRNTMECHVNWWKPLGIILYCTVKLWVGKFQQGRVSTCDEQRSGRFTHGAPNAAADGCPKIHIVDKNNRQRTWPVFHGDPIPSPPGPYLRTATAGSDVVQSGRPTFDDFFQHLWPYIGNNTANVVFQMVKRLWLIRIDQ
ncbi:HTH_48 domain-containing protein [Trichonephila clavipes]|nr:HTH_48 domain-containing protein [Trichonephila clavipes]